MFDKWRRKKEGSSQEVQKAIPKDPYDRREELHSLALFVTIVSRNQSEYYVQAYQGIGAALSMVLYSYSMPPSEIVKMLGIDGTKKDIVMTVARSEYLPAMKDIAEKRFAVSKAAKGIAFSLPVSSVAGVAVYKFLADQNKEIRTTGK